MKHAKKRITGVARKECKVQCVGEQYVSRVGGKDEEKC
jgi:hypothetical protein